MRSRISRFVSFLLLSLSCSMICSASAVKFVPDEVIVKFKPGVSARTIRQINRLHRTSVLYTSPFAGFKRIRIPKGTSVDDMVDRFRRNPNVEYAVPNSIAHAHMVPNDSYYSYQWNFDDQKVGGNPYGRDNGGGINLEPAWDISTGAGAVVAVLDSGVAYESYGGQYRLAPDLAGTSFVAGWDFVNDDAHPNDDNSHGTHVTGTIAQTTNNSIGVAGVAFNCSIMPVKVLNGDGEGTLQQLVDGIYYAVDNGAHILNMSLGWPPGYDPGQLLKDALDYAYNHDVTSVCSSGNDGVSTVGYPAAYWTAIAVGATRYDETRPDYSNYGAELDLVAPGGDLSVDQNGDGYNDGILQNTFNPMTKNARDFSYWFFDGTSMAAPHVSGAAALLVANGVTSPDDIRQALVLSAEDTGSSGWDAVYGWGIIDAYAALNLPTRDPSVHTLTVGELRSFDDTYVSPFEGWADLAEKMDVPEIGVEYHIAMYGITEIEIGVGSQVTLDLSGDSTYALSFTNTSVDDTFNVKVYLKTGAAQTYYSSGWWTLLPSPFPNTATITWDLSGVDNLDDVREIGFAVSGWMGNEFGMADDVMVRVERPAP